jgi:hypothetical protein
MNWAKGANGEVRVLAPTAILGYGYPLSSLEAGLAAGPDFIGVDAGSTDPGPYYLGSGRSFTSRGGVQRDLTPLLTRAKEAGIPLIVGSSGGAGGDPHLEWTYDIVHTIAAEQGINLRVALVHAEQSTQSVLDALTAGRLRSLGPVPEATPRDIERSVRIVGQMGPEPIQAAVETGADVILAGRSCDVSVFAAIPLARGMDPGPTLHASKIVECGAYCAEPAGASDGILATIRHGEFDLHALSPERRVTAVSAAAHSLYEQGHPSLIVEPMGSVDAADAEFLELADGGVRVRGSRFERASQYTVKLEGAALAGYRAVTVGGVRDPIAIEHIDDILEGARAQVAATYGPEDGERPYRISFLVYGRDGVMGPMEPERSAVQHEIGVVADVVANDQQHADDICALTRSSILHQDFTDRMTVGGNVAFPFSPHDASWGPVYELSLYHLMDVDDPLEPFPLEVREP